MSIQQRKKDHVELTTKGDVAYRKSAGFECYDFIHNALPELNPEDVRTDATLLGREFSFPLFISSMTGGFSEGHSINSLIAEFCQRHNLPFGVGSQRILLEEPSTIGTFRIVRKKAPDAFIAANIGGAQLIGGLPPEKITILIDSIRADAVIVHLNPLQELMQPEGDHRFEGIGEGIARLVEQAAVPVIVKETGAGLAERPARLLLQAGVRVLDVAGAGGTSWSRVENLRKKEGKESEIEEIFNEWGIPTVECILQVGKLRNEFPFEMIASGGIRSPFDMIKALALGADFTAAAQPVITALRFGGLGELERLYRHWRESFRMALTLLGCPSPDRLEPGHLRKV